MRVTYQALRFLVVGVASNVVLYGLYLAATSVGIGHKSAMTCLFSLGVVQTFFFNKNWSFQDRNGGGSTFVRYLVAYLVAYAINLGAMLVLVDSYHLSARAVQAVMIVVVAIFMFAMQRWWVFRSPQHAWVGQE